jgi:large subunit ribosomal protein L17
MYRNMVTSLLDHERIETTDAKAKAVRRIAERMITLGKRGDLHARRRALRVIRSREVAAKVFDDLAVRYRDRAGGYTRVLKLRNRVGDAAALSVVELVEGAPQPEKPATGAEAKKSAATAKKATSKKATGEKAAAKKKTAAKKTSKKKAAASPDAKKKTSKKKTAVKKSTSKKK